MPVDEHRQAGELRGGLAEQLVHILHGLRDAQVPASSSRLAMSAQIHREDREALVGETLREMAVTAGVLPETVDEADDCPRLIVGEPLLTVDLNAVGSLVHLFGVLHSGILPPHPATTDTDSAVCVRIAPNEAPADP